MTRLAEWLLARRHGPRWEGRAGHPRSTNGASSHHLVWDVPPGRWVAATATLEVLVPPAVPRLSFWALQVGFEDRGRRAGAAHLGLQWHPPHPGSTAVNWGGYDADGRELSGSASALPSATGNPNTRDLPWQPARPYRLRVDRAPATTAGAPGWRGTVTDLVTGEAVVVRDLFVDAPALVAPMVWSEVFADCDAPAASVAWSDLALTGDDGATATVARARATYQAPAAGGCVTSDSSVVGTRFVQASGVERRTPAGTWLELPPGQDEARS